MLYMMSSAAGWWVHAADRWSQRDALGVSILEG
jgi:hypothetical protein